MTVRDFNADDLPDVTATNQQVADVINQVEQHGLLELFKEMGRKTRHLITEGGDKEAEYAVITAIAYTLATYDTGQGQVDDAWREEVDGPRDIEGMKACIRRTRHGNNGEDTDKKDKTDWFTEIVETGAYEGVTRAYQDGNMWEAHRELDALTGFGKIKTPMVSLCLGFPDAWVMDRNVVVMMTDFFKKSADLKVLPRCESCWNACNRQDAEPDSMVGDMWDRRVWTKQPYFTNYHLSNHLDSVKERRGYKIAGKRHLDKHHSQARSARIWTQILFNVGQRYIDGKSIEETKRFDIHVPFYRTLGTA